MIKCAGCAKENPVNEYGLCESCWNYYIASHPAPFVAVKVPEKPLDKQDKV